MARRKTAQSKFDIGNYLQIEWKAVRRAVLFVLIVMGLICGVCFAGYSYMKSASYFTVKHVLCSPKKCSSFTNIQQLISALQGMNILDVDINTIETFVRNKYPQVSRVQVKRQLPDTIRIYMYWRKPYVQIKADRYYLIDKNGISLSRTKDVPFVKLPIITGVAYKKGKNFTYNVANVKNAVKLVSAIKKNTTLPVSENMRIDATQQDQLIFYLENGVEVRVGGEDFSKRIMMLSTIIRKLGVEKLEEVAYIDLRFKDVIVGSKES